MPLQTVSQCRNRALLGVQEYGIMMVATDVSNKLCKCLFFVTFVRNLPSFQSEVVLVFWYIMLSLQPDTAALVVLQAGVFPSFYAQFLTALAAVLSLLLLHTVAPGQPQKCMQSHQPVLSLRSPQICHDPVPDRRCTCQH